MPGSAPLVFAAAFFGHAHLLDQCRGLVAAGAVLKWFFEPDTARRAQFLVHFPSVRCARSLEEILADSEVELVAAAAIPCERATLGSRVLLAGKDYFTDKPALTTPDQLAMIRQLTARTGRKYLVYFSERLQHGAVRRATELIAAGAIGRVLQVTALGPHRLRPANRPPWFFSPAQTGGILVDLSCHQIEQFLTWTGAREAAVVQALMANRRSPEHPQFEDYGEVNLRTSAGETAFIRVDWLSPEGLPTWGDGRSVVLGTDGYLEIRKYIDVGRDASGNHLYLVDARGEQHLTLPDPSLGEAFAPLVQDCRDRTERAMTQEHIFLTTELSLQAQAKAASR